MYYNDDMETVAKKIQYYQDFLDVIGKVDPGYPTVNKPHLAGART